MYILLTYSVYIMQWITIHTNPFVSSGVINSDLTRNMNKTSRRLLKPIAALFFKDVEAGAQTTLYCAVQEGIESLSGRYFSNCALQKVKAKAQDDAVAKKLWEVSETLSGLS